MTSPDQSGNDSAPSLFAAASPAGSTRPPSAGPSDGLRMLAGLDTQPGDLDDRPARAWKGPIAAAFGLALLVGAGGWWKLSRDAVSVELAGLSAAATASGASGAIAALAAGTSVSADPAGPAAASASAAEVASPAGPVAASIETLTARPTLVDSHAASAAPTAVSAPTLDNGVGATESAVGSSSAASTASGSRAAARRAPPVRTAAREAPDATRRSASPASGDSDVELMTAMVAHLEGKDRESKERLVRALTKPAPKREPILQASTIDKLVRSCKQFAGAEPEHCRRQICEGSWGRVAACPARLAPDRAVSRH